MSSIGPSAMALPQPYMQPNSAEQAQMQQLPQYGYAPQMGYMPQQAAQMPMQAQIPGQTSAYGPASMYAQHPSMYGAPQQAQIPMYGAAQPGAYGPQYMPMGGYAPDIQQMEPPSAGSTILKSMAKTGLIGAGIGAGFGLIPFLPPSFIGGALIGGLAGAVIGLIRGRSAARRNQDEYRIMMQQFAAQASAGMPASTQPGMAATAAVQPGVATRPGRKPKPRPKPRAGVAAVGARRATSHEALHRAAAAQGIRLAPHTHRAGS